MLEPLELARRLFESQNIQTFIFESPYADLARFDAGMRARFFPAEDYGVIARWICGTEKRESQCTPGNIYLHEDFLRLCSVVVPLPPSGGSQSQRFFVASPFLFDRPTENDIQQILQDAGGNAASKALLDFYRDIPTAGMQRDRFQSFLGSLFSSLFGTNEKQAPLKFVYHYFAKSQSFLYTPADTDSVDERDVKTIEKRYQIEDAMHEAVKCGDEQRAIALYKQITQSGIKPRTPNSVRNIKNFLIVLNSHLRKIMEISGVHPYYVDAVSGDFAIQIEECTTNAQLYDLSALMIKTYCQQIREHRISGYSESVRRCVTYIEFHYAEYLSLQALSDEMHLNASYLSAQFKKETGHTVTEYISYTRIKHALPLLAQSSRSIEDIAATCGFDDMNYFARVFRKIMNMSPTVYRKQARVLKIY